MEPAFSPNVRHYTVNCPANVSKFNINASVDLSKGDLLGLAPPKDNFVQWLSGKTLDKNGEMTEHGYILAGYDTSGYIEPTQNATVTMLDDAGGAAVKIGVYNTNGGVTTYTIVVHRKVVNEKTALSSLSIGSSTVQLQKGVYDYKAYVYCLETDTPPLEYAVMALPKSSGAELAYTLENVSGQLTINDSDGIKLVFGALKVSGEPITGTLCIKVTNGGTSDEYRINVELVVEAPEPPAGE